MDSFFASVEIRENPSLKGKAIAVGGSPEKRGVLATCSYEARKFGLHSAMSSAQAMKILPSLIIIPPNFELYKSVSKQVFEIFQRYTDKIESLSLDEAYLDVTESDKFDGSATLIAKDIRKKIFEELHLTASAGVAPLKFLAKIASDKNKPNGMFVILPTEVDDFIKNLPLKKIPGVGAVTQEKLKKLGFETCFDVQKSEKYFFLENFGKFGGKIWDFSHGIDDREVETQRVRKSLSVETTLDFDIDNIFLAEDILKNLYKKLLFRAKKFGKKISFYKRIGVKLKFEDFTQTTLEKTTSGASKQNFLQILNQAWKRRENRKIRLIGITIHFPEQKNVLQLKLWEDDF
ncbi:DNA polymerase IV [Candidatus Gracilibacteria bacterium]|nr:MAG: DNA polymerase IV [Candidatus Gracilibacteria bacterium]